MEQSSNRLQILKRIEELEAKGLFDLDVEDDPPSKPLLPNKVDYLNKKLTSKIKTLLANHMGRSYFDKQIKKGNMILEETIGLEHLYKLECGAMLTCNHFNPFDNYALFKCIEPALKKRDLYKIIREGNYTAYPGLYGFLFRNCNTLPLSSNLSTMKLMMSAVDTLLKRGEKILIYPEQGMWWNYRKPRPLKSGAFKFAVKSKAPVVPCFITMKDSDKLDGDGFPIQRYTIHILEPLYPNESLSPRAQEEDLKDRNYKVWKELYERVYGEPLVYSSDKEV